MVIQVPSRGRPNRSAPQRSASVIIRRQLVDFPIAAEMKFSLARTVWTETS